MDSKQQDKDLWRFRRILVFGSTGFAMIMIAYIIFAGLEGELAESAVNAGFLFMGSVVLTYIGGAVTDDHLKRGKSGSK